MSKLILKLQFFFKKTIQNTFFLSLSLLLECPSPCLKCSELSTDKCTTCTAGYLLNGTTCITDSSCLENGYSDDGITCKGFFFSD